ncbi:hypothetical protein ILP97_27650 [Amycolatopsis sp. H6(2020)]|nr:hypothetical protein [Amycolatopsis sp. H6(2020)]
MLSMDISDWKRTIYAAVALPAYLAGPKAARAAMAGRRTESFGFFWTEEGAAGSWGGPSLIGAWAVHFFGAHGMAVVAMWVLRPLIRWQVRTPDLVDSSHGR